MSSTAASGFPYLPLPDGEAADNCVNMDADATSSEDDDEALIALVQDGDRDSLASLFHIYAHPVRNVGLRILRDRAEADERFGYRPSAVHWREVWMSLAAIVVLALALALTAYRTGVKRGTEAARATAGPI